MSLLVTCDLNLAIWGEAPSCRSGILSEEGNQDLSPVPLDQQGFDLSTSVPSYELALGDERRCTPSKAEQEVYYRDGICSTPDRGRDCHSYGR